VTARPIALVAGVVTILAAGCGGSAETADWALPNHDLSATRAVSSRTIDASSVARLEPAWRFRFRIQPRESGVVTATPVVAGGTVYVQDMESNVFALDLESGALRWAHPFRAGNPGPNGLAVGDERVYGSTDTEVFALSAARGLLLWRRRILTPVEQFVDVAPMVAHGLVYTSTIGYPPGGRGALYALDAATGFVRWKRSTIRGPWRYPVEAGGGGAWYPPSIDAQGRVYWGTANPAPWGGTRRRPNGGSFPGSALYTDSLLALDGRTGRLLWYDQVTPHDVRDYDFQLSPLLVRARGRDLLIGAGKAGRVIAWDRRTHRRVWQTPVGLHRNDAGPLPPRSVAVCPGLLGGVETPMAYVDGRVFVPVVDLCSRGSAVGYEPLERLDPFRGRGELVALDAATGRSLWKRPLDSPDFGCATAANDVVFSSTLDGRIYAFRAHDGEQLWSRRMRAGINACPAVAGGLLLVPAGVPLRRGRSVFELVAYRPM
jgi:outer membrane protein assembly factor BamB